MDRVNYDQPSVVPEIAMFSRVDYIPNERAYRCYIGDHYRTVRVGDNPTKYRARIRKALYQLWK